MIFTFQSVRIWIKTFVLKVLLSLMLHVVNTYNKFSLPKFDFKDTREFLPCHSIFACDHNFLSTKVWNGEASPSQLSSSFSYQFLQGPLVQNEFCDEDMDCEFRHSYRQKSLLWPWWLSLIYGSCNIIFLHLLTITLIAAWGLQLFSAKAW